MNILSDDEDDEIMAAVMAARSSTVAITAFFEDEQKKEKEDHERAIHDHRTAKRGPRRVFDHERAFQCIYNDFLQPNALFGSQFKVYYRLSRPRFELLMQQVKKLQIHFYDAVPSRFLPARLLLPLKTLAYGVPSHAFCPYFQVSPQLARDCCFMFDIAIKRIFKADFLRLPTRADLRSILNLHYQVHAVKGMFGSLDCTHTYWKNCPKGWQGSFKGKENKPSIVLEAISDYNMFFWHVSYGYAGTLNDKNILNLSPFHDRLMDGTFCNLEKEAECVPFNVGDAVFDKTFILVDGIYPTYSRFVKGISQPVDEEEKAYTAWQESARKDVERAFGMLKATWQFLARPIFLLDLKTISARATTCLILHNVLVGDRVMGEPGLLYNPQASLTRNAAGVITSHEEVEVDQPPDLSDVQQKQSNIDFDIVNAMNDSKNAHPQSLVNVVTRRERWLSLKDPMEHERLFLALKKRFGNKNY